MIYKCPNCNGALEYNPSYDGNASDYYANQISRTNIEILRQQQVS